MSRLLPFSHRVDHVHQSLDQFKLSSSPADSSGEGNQASLKRAIRHVRVVLDSGSHRSYITEQVAKDLSPQSEGKQSMTVMTFGSTTEQRHLCELMRLNIALKNGQQKQFKLFTVPVICEPLSSQPVTLCQDTFDHIMNLDLADPSDGCSQLDVDILIGSDQYWDLATGNTCRGIDGPVAIETGLGWVLSGPVPMTTHVFKINAAPTRRSRLGELLQSFCMGVGVARDCQN